MLISLVCYQVLFTVGDGASLNSRQFGFRDGNKNRDHKLCSDSLVHGELTKMKVIDFKGAFGQAFNHCSDSLKSAGLSPAKNPIFALQPKTELIAEVQRKYKGPSRTKYKLSCMHMLRPYSGMLMNYASIQIGHLQNFPCFRQTV